MWRLPLPDDYREHLRSDIADRHSSPSPGAGAVIAALYSSSVGAAETFVVAVQVVALAAFVPLWRE